MAHAFVGTAEPNGYNYDPLVAPHYRRLQRGGVDARLAWHTMSFETFARFNDWGPYDYHRDFNLTFPTQLMGDLSHTLGAPRWLGLNQSRIGVRALWRTLDKDSRYSPVGAVPNDVNVVAPDGREWEDPGLT